MKTLFTLLLVISVHGESAMAIPHGELIQQLASGDESIRTAAEARLVVLGHEAADALVHSALQDPPSQPIRDATLRILGQWERDSWANADAAAAVNAFVRSAREQQNASAKHHILSSDEFFPYAEKVRVLDVPPDQAAAYLRGKRGISIGEAAGRARKPIYVDITLKHDWVVEPKDWLYIANLADDIGGGETRSISIDVQGPIESDALIESLKFFRKSQDGHFSLHFDEARVTRDALLVLRSYHKMTRFAANYGAGDMRDEEWANCITAWPKLTSLTLLREVGPKAIAAANGLTELRILYFRNVQVAEADLAVFRTHKSLQVLKVVSDGPYLQYLNQQGTGKWQVEGGQK